MTLLGHSADPETQALLIPFTDAQHEPDAAVREAASDSLQKIKHRLLLGDLLGQAFMGLSLGSVLLLAALGLAITYGLLGVINMAHGEMLMIGAYSCWLVQQALAQLAPQWLAFYPLVALPVAFLVTAGIGMALERTIIRHLYGRPLETLLATWGISLMLIQLVRMLFGAQNVEVANPAWLSGGVQVLPNLILPWNRLAVLAFVLLVLCFTWLILNRTRLGMNVRAVTQNRAMAPAAACLPGGWICWLLASAPVLPGWAAWRCRSLATSGLNWVRDTSSTRFWWWCWAASASWPAAWRRPLGWAFSTKFSNRKWARCWARS